MKKLLIFLILISIAFGQAYRSPDIVPYRLMFSEKTNAEIITLGNPPAAWVYVYAKDDGLLYLKLPAGTEYCFAGGAGVFTSITDGVATLTGGALSGITTIGMSGQLTNSLADGTTPMVITSTTKVSNLNVDRVDGVHLASLTDTRLMRYESTGTQIENATVTETSGALGGITTIGMSGQLTNSLAIGTSPFAVTSTTVNTNLNADLLDAKSEAAFATLAEAETVSGKYTFSDTLIASKAVKGADGVLLTNETATKATLPSNTSWMYPYDDGSNVHLMATKDDAGTETVVKIAEQSSITNLSSGGAFYYGDGTDDYISIADNANLRFGTGNFGFIFKNLRLSDYTPSAAVTIARKANAGAENLGWIFTLETDGKPQIAFGNATNFTTLAYKSATAINATDGTTIHLAAIITRETASVAGSVKFYQFGYDTWKLLSSVAITAGTPQTVTEITPSALLLFQNINGTTEYAFQSFGGFIPCNFAPTYAEVKEFIEKGIPAKYQWGSQTNLVTGGLFVSPDWREAVGFSIAANKYVLTNVANTFVGYSQGSIVITTGKKYRVTYTIESRSEGGVRIENSGESAKTADGTYTEETLVLNSRIAFEADGETSLTISNIILTQIGAVVAYDGKNMTASTAYDASSNNLDGTVSGATLLNAKVADAFNNPNTLPTDDALLSIQDYSGYDGSGNVTDYGYWQSFQRTVLNGDESWGLKLSGLMDNAISNLLEWDLSGVAVGQGTLVFNEDSKDIDVRIESDINNAISVDGATGNVILGAAADVVGALTAGSIVSDAQVTATTTVSGATYGSNGSVTDAELLYVNTLSSNAQDQLDARCLESVFGTAIGTGLTLDATTLKTHAALQSIAGLTEADVSILEATADNTYSVVTSGGNNYMLASDGTNANLVFVQPSTVLSNIGAQPVDANLTSIAGLSHAVGDILYANAATTYLSLADVAAGQPLLSGGVTTAPAYAGYTFSGTAAQTYTFPTSSASLAPLAAPTFVTSFTSPGIDDNADAIAITIDVTTEKVNMSGACDIDGALTANVFNYYADTSSVNDSWGFTAAAIGAYTTGLSIFVNIGVANTDGATLQINALGAKAVLKMHDTALATNNVEVGQIIHLIYDGTQFQMLSQVAN